MSGWPRWVVPTFLLAGWTVANLWVWLRPAELRQGQVITTMISSFIVVVLGALWFFVFSGTTVLARRVGFAVVVTLLAVVPLVRISGVTGDLIPILSWRWAAPPNSTLDVAPRVVTARAIAPTRHDSPQFLGPAWALPVGGALLAGGLLVWFLWRKK